HAVKLPIKPGECIGRYERCHLGIVAQAPRRKEQRERPGGLRIHQIDKCALDVTRHARRATADGFAHPGRQLQQPLPLVLGKVKEAHGCPPLPSLRLVASSSDCRRSTVCCTAAYLDSASRSAPCVATSCSCFSSRRVETARARLARPRFISMLAAFMRAEAK